MYKFKYKYSVFSRAKYLKTAISFIDSVFLIMLMKHKYYILLLALYCAHGTLQMLDLIKRFRH